MTPAGPWGLLVNGSVARHPLGSLLSSGPAARVLPAHSLGGARQQMQPCPSTWQPRLSQRAQAVSECAGMAAGELEAPKPHLLVHWESPRMLGLIGWKEQVLKYRWGSSCQWGCCHAGSAACLPQSGPAGWRPGHSQLPQLLWWLLQAGPGSPHAHHCQAEHCKGRQKVSGHVQVHNSPGKDCTLGFHGAARLSELMPDYQGCITVS